MKSSSCARVKLVKIKPNMLLHKERARHSAKPEWSPIHQNHQSETKTETREPIMSQQSFRTVSDRAKLHHSKYDRFNRKQHPDASAPCWETSNCILGQRKAACWGSLPTRSDLSTKTLWRFPLCYFWLLINSLQFSNLHDRPVFFVFYDFKFIQFELFAVKIWEIQWQLEHLSAKLVWFGFY